MHELHVWSADRLGFRKKMLPSWVSDVIAAGSEDATKLEMAYNELASSPLVKYVKPLGGRKGIYATLWCTSAA